MTAQRIAFVQIVCDDCGRVTNEYAPDATSARLAAQLEGWTYRTFVRQNDRGGHGMTRSDLCQECSTNQQNRSQ